MAKSYYLPNSDGGKMVLLTELADKLPAVKTVLGLSDADVAAQKADALYFDYVIQMHRDATQYLRNWTTFKNDLRDGKGNILGAAPTLPTRTAPAAVAAGVIPRLIALVARLRAAPGCTKTIAENLKIVGEEGTVDTATLKPRLIVTQVGNHIIVAWTKQGIVLDGIEIWVDRGDGKGFVFLTIDTIPDYTDTAPLPVAGQSALWKYKAIYRLADEQVGQWSDPVSLAVAGA
jgi:hypothetical protein